MKIYQWVACATCIVFAFAACNDSPIGDDFADIHYGGEGAIIIPDNVQKGFFDLASPDEAAIAFDIDSKGEAVSSAEVIATHSSGVSAVFETVTSFPATIDVKMTDLLDALGIDVDSVAVGEDVLFTFDSETAGGTYKSSETLSIPFSCKSELAADLSYVSTNYFCTGDALSGDVTMSEVGAGKYVFDDWSFGTYTQCYGGPPSEGSLQFVDVCNKIDITGVDAYGDGWQFAIDKIDGSDMTINWTNDYGEFGTVVLTRKDGTVWPTLSN